MIIIFFYLEINYKLYPGGWFLSFFLMENVSKLVNDIEDEDDVVELLMKQLLKIDKNTKNHVNNIKENK